MSARIYIIGRIRNERFESFQGVVFSTRAEARDFLEDELTPRIAPRDGWTVFESVDMLAHLNGNDQSVD